MKHILFYSISFILFLSVGKNAMAQQNNYELLFLHNNYDSIIDIAKYKIDKEIYSPVDYFWYSLSLQKKGRYKENINLLETALGKYQDNDTLRKLLAFVYYESGNYKKAIPFLLQLNKDNESQIYLAKIYEFYNEYENTINIYKKLLKQDSSNYEYLKKIGKNYYRLDSFKIALYYYKAAINNNPDDQPSAFKLSQIYLKLDSCEQSISSCERILKIDSLNSKFLKQNAYSNFKCKNYNEAKYFFSKCLELGDSSEFILKFLGIAEMNSHDFHEGRKHLMHAYKKDSLDFEICFFLGRAFLNSTEKEKALFFLNKADSIIQPKTDLLVAINEEKASIYSELGLHDKELASRKTCYELSLNPEFLFYIASTYQNKLGDKEQALKYYKLFVSALPEKKTSEHVITETQLTISLKKLAEDNIIKLTEDLFFEAK